MERYRWRRLWGQSIREQMETLSRLIQLSIMMVMAMDLVTTNPVTIQTHTSMIQTTMATIIQSIPSLGIQHSMKT